MDVVLNKKVSLDRCLQQVSDYYVLPSELSFQEDYLKQDAIAINLQRACEICIDMANHTIKNRKLGLPKESRDSFRILESAKIIDNALSQKLQNMVGFRNIVVHSYQELDLDLMVDVIENHLEYLRDYAQIIVNLFIK